MYDNQPGADRLPRLGGSTAAHRQWTAMSLADLNHALQIPPCGRNHDAQRNHFIYAGVGGVNGPADLVKPHLTLDGGRKSFVERNHVHQASIRLGNRGRLQLND